MTTYRMEFEDGIVLETTPENDPGAEIMFKALFWPNFHFCGDRVVCFQRSLDGGATWEDLTHRIRLEFLGGELSEVNRYCGSKASPTEQRAIFVELLARMLDDGFCEGWMKPDGLELANTNIGWVAVEFDDPDDSPQLYSLHETTDGYLIISAPLYAISLPELARTRLITQGDMEEAMAGKSEVARK